MNKEVQERTDPLSLHYVIILYFKPVASKVIKGGTHRWADRQKVK
jgi:hypothetical protein